MVLSIGLAAALISLVLTPAAGKLAWKIDAVDIPKDWRRMHKSPIPRTGGIAVFFAILVPVSVLPVFGEADRFHLSALAGAGAVFCIGLADDRSDLPAPLKFFVQTVAAACVVFPDGGIPDPWRFPAILWILALTNAHNFIDGLDGLFPGCACVEGSALSALFLLTGREGDAPIPAAVAGACLGFLFYNRHPARIFSGDCGSGSVGFLLGVSSLSAFFGTEWRFGLLSPFFLFAYPLTDLVTAVTRRVFRAKNIFSADRAHLHHRIGATGLGQTGTAACLLSLSALLALTGLLLSSPRFAWGAVGAILSTLFSMEAIRRFLLLFAEKGCNPDKNVIKSR